MRRAIVLFILFLLLCVSAAGETTVRVGARVVPFLLSSAVYDSQTIDVDAETRSVTVTGKVMVRTNDPAGYLVVFEPNPDVVRGAEIEGLSAPLRSGAAPAFAVEPLTTVKMSVREVRIRLDLQKGVQPGRHALPFTLSIRQLTF
jgi:hypothetical protein